ncbi:MipA/OmpV family protein [Azospirillum thermophilum]|uniref:MipA/OmpV family protein n=1 Tax=Azospirillum thermophilum TaxID=2202148 RepID=A0A2S2CXD1_9PROT|nr:MipA/OmpV family protein [Azospirillum thermophilum]AWK89129.1 hypothetical protein DEW08_24340 [Azospirillum thermophilum]
MSRPLTRRPIRITVLLGLAAVSSLAGAPALADPAKSSEPGKRWNFVIGGGAGVAPKYEGGRKLEVTPVPFVNLGWNDTVFLGNDGLGARYAINDLLSVGMSVGWAPGRKEKDGPRLRGMGKIEDAARVKAFTTLSLGAVSFNASVAQDVGGSRGLLAEVGAGYTVPLGDTVNLAFGVSTTYASERHMREFFGVGAAQSRRSGHAAYKPGAGLKEADGTVTLTWQITDHVSAIAVGGAGVLLGDARKSPIVERQLQPFVAAGLTYRF